MRLLLDTNVLIRMLEEPERLPRRIQAALDDTENDLVVTTASLVEIAIKVGIGRLAMPPRLLQRLEALGCRILMVTPAHALRLAQLPLVHRDPFDRLIVAQALVENLILVTSDGLLSDYGVVTLKG